MNIEFVIDYLKSRLGHIYVSLCSYLNFLPVSSTVRHFYPLTCANCPCFSNNNRIVIVPYFPILNDEYKHYVLGFCSDGCLEMYKNYITLNDKNVTGNYIKLLKHRKFTQFEAFTNELTRFQVMKMICNPLIWQRSLYKLTFSKGEKSLMIRHGHLYVNWKKVDEVEYDVDHISDVDFFPYTLNTKVVSRLRVERVNKLLKINN